MSKHNFQLLERVLNADNLKTISKSEAVKTSVNTNVCYLCNQVEFKVKEDYDKHMNEVHKFINIIFGSAFVGHNFTAPN